MEVSYNEVNKVFKTLPIGYYLGRDVPVTLSETSTSSYYNMRADTITLSYPTLADTLSQIEDDVGYIEKDTRCLLYHEVSHVIATPNFNYEISSWLNIFEDERIETLFRNYYRGVNFKEFIRRVNHYDEWSQEEPKSSEDYFYRIVRFREGPEEFVTRTGQIISKYPCFKGPYQVEDYYEEVKKLWEDVCKDFHKDHPDAPDYNEGEGMRKLLIIGKMSSDDQEGCDNWVNLDDYDEIEVLDDGDEGEEEDAGDESPDAKEGGAIISDVGKGGGKYRTPDVKNAKVIIKNLIKRKIDVYEDPAMESKFRDILLNHNRKNGRNSEAINSYSGTFDVRSVVRDDYKYFIAKNRLGNVRQFNKLHLNLFIDNSGSFAGNDRVVNTMLRCLSKIEKSTKDFEYQLVTINMEVKVRDKDDRVLDSNGCNRLPKELFGIVKKFQCRNANVINIVLFDGWFCTGEGDAEAAIPNCAAFNLPRTTIITCTENAPYFKQYCTSARIIETEDYVNKLIGNVLTGLEAML